MIGANVAVFVLWRIADTRFMRKHFMISLDNVKSGRLHTMLTSAFSHAELEHLVSNMIGLYFFGTSIGRLFGPEYLLKLYFAGALGGSIFFLLHKVLMAPSPKGTFGLDYSRIPGLGASAAVNAIILLDVFLFPKNIYYVNLIIPVPAMLMGALIIGTDLWRVRKGEGDISGSAHLGGALVAALAWARIKGWI